MTITIISGGQTGADMGGLLAARDLGLPTAGFAPDGWETEDGPNPRLADFGLVPRGSYSARTCDNVQSSDAVVCIGYRTGGTKLTLDTAARRDIPALWLLWRSPEQYGPERPWWDVKSPEGAEEALWAFLEAHRPGRLMVAGSRESKNPGVADATRRLVRAVLADW